MTGNPDPDCKKCKGEGYVVVFYKSGRLKSGEYCDCAVDWWWVTGDDGLRRLCVLPKGEKPEGYNDHEEVR